MNNLFKKISFACLAFSFINAYALDSNGRSLAMLEINKYNEEQALLEKKIDKVTGIVAGGGTIFLGLVLAHRGAGSMPKENIGLLVISSLALCFHGLHMVTSRLEYYKKTESAELSSRSR